MYRAGGAKLSWSDMCEELNEGLLCAPLPSFSGAVHPRRRDAGAVFLVSELAYEKGARMFCGCRKKSRLEHMTINCS